MAFISRITRKFYDSSVYRGYRSCSSKVNQGVVNCIPGWEIKSDKVINFLEKAGSDLTSAEQRLILGATALLSQPFIDAQNKEVDEKTRKISVARTIAKIIAGTLTGFAIRKACIVAIQKSSVLSTSVNKLGEKIKMTKWNTIFSPKDVKSDTTDAYKQYRNAMGTVVALVVMSFTNFLIDAPLTKVLTNWFAKMNGGQE